VGNAGHEVYYVEKTVCLPSCCWRRPPEIVNLKTKNRFRRAFVLIDAKHGPKSSDLMLLERLGREGVSYQIVLSKIDKLSPFNGDLERAFLDTKYLMETGLGGVSGLGEVLGVAGDPAKKGPKIGINDLRWSIMVACGLGGVR
jgi:GTP-binding protein